MNRMILAGLMALYGSTAIAQTEPPKKRTCKEAVAFYGEMVTQAAEMGAFTRPTSTNAYSTQIIPDTARLLINSGVTSVKQSCPDSVVIKIQQDARYQLSRMYY